MDSFLDALVIAGELRPMTVELWDGHLHTYCLHVFLAVSLIVQVEHCRNLRAKDPIIRSFALVWRLKCD